MKGIFCAFIRSCLRGSEGSNPASSSRESHANLSFRAVLEELAYDRDAPSRDRWYWERRTPG